MSHQEIERKWLMDGFPELPHHSEEFQQQGYLSFGPATVRLRKTEYAGAAAQYWLTIKGGGGLQRTEVELPLDVGQFAALWPLLAGPGATKRLRRYRLPGGQELECSLVDEGEAGAFYYAEVEFASLAEAEAFAPPAWLGREVTGTPGYSMAEHCRQKQKG